MKKQLPRHFRDASLMGKINIVIGILTLVLTTLITAISIFYYSFILSDRQFERTKQAAQNASETLNYNYKNIMDRLTAICGTAEFSSDIRMLASPSVSYIVQERLVQNELSDLAGCNYLVQSALVLSGDGKTAYSLYKNPLPDTAEFFTEEELYGLHGVTCLPIRQSPLRSRVPVLPLVVPIRVNEAEYAVVNITDEPSDVYVVVYLDCTKLLQSLTLASTGLAEGTYYLFTEDGVPLSPSSYDKKTNPLMLPETDALIRTLTETDETHTAAQTSDFYLAASHMAKSGLILLECVPKEPFYDIFGPTIDFLAIVLFLVVGILLVISRMMTRYITRPVTQLMAIVERIRENRYEHKQELGTGDEMGHLCTAINQMHDTIQKQMERIKQEESEKYMAEIRLLTEQINPHFLYNTLDCIQSEVKRGESDTAANMIQYLAEYLRIGLSNGADLIPLSSEIRHANAYVRLMNQRFGQSIRFMYHLAPGLSHHLIVKTILQPLVENSIKHGFGVDSPGIPISTPAIEVIITAEEDELVININDNGSGFEPSELDELLKKSSTAKGGHVGILNVYQRLTAYYGAEKVYISFSSIPYYCNVISIRIPLGS